MMYRSPRRTLIPLFLLPGLLLLACGGTGDQSTDRATRQYDIPSATSNEPVPSATSDEPLPSATSDEPVPGTTSDDPTTESMDASCYEKQRGYGIQCKINCANAASEPSCYSECDTWVQSLYHGCPGYPPSFELPNLPPHEGCFNGCLPKTEACLASSVDELNRSYCYLYYRSCAAKAFKEEVLPQYQ